MTHRLSFSRRRWKVEFREADGLLLGQKKGGDQKYSLPYPTMPHGIIRSSLLDLLG